MYEVDLKDSITAITIRYFKQENQESVLTWTSPPSEEETEDNDVEIVEEPSKLKFIYTYLCIRFSCDKRTVSCYIRNLSE